MRKWIYYTFLCIAIIIFIYFKWISKSTPPASYAAQVKSSRLREVSGLVFSIQNKDLLWMHNDSGGGKKLFLVDKSGNTRAVFQLSASLRDWEDIAIGPGPVNDKPLLYAGDIGDNYARRRHIYIHRFQEPRIGEQTEIKDIDVLVLKYPDGSRDAEAMFVDPVSRKIYIITKREANVGIYCAPSDFTSGDTITLKKVGVLHIQGIKMLGWVTAADISRDGKDILVRTYGNVFYWERKEGQSVESAMRAEPTMLTHVAEVQGEAIGFTPNGKGYYTIREGKFPYLNYNSIPK